MTSRKRYTSNLGSHCMWSVKYNEEATVWAPRLEMSYWWKANNRQPSNCTSNGHDKWLHITICNATHTRDFCNVTCSNLGIVVLSERSHMTNHLPVRRDGREPYLASLERRGPKILLCLTLLNMICHIANFFMTHYNLRCASFSTNNFLEDVSVCLARPWWVPKRSLTYTISNR